jgi:hypothetical protein
MKVNWIKRQKVKFRKLVQIILLVIKLDPSYREDKKDDTN